MKQKDNYSTNVIYYKILFAKLSIYKSNLIYIHVINL